VTYSPLPPEAAHDAPPTFTLRQWWWLPAGWIALGFLFSIQPWLAGFMGFGETVQFAAMRLAPWALVAPAAVWLSLRFPIAGPQWPRALVLHAFATAIALLCLESPLSFMVGPRMGRSHFSFRDRGGSERFVGFGGTGPATAATDESGTSSANEETKPPQPPPRLEEGKNVLFERGLRKGGFRHEPGDGPRFVVSGPPPWFMRGQQSLPLYWCLVAAAHVLYFQRTARRAAQVEAQLTMARLAALQLQLQPHFLFNSLNAISSLVRSDAEAADEMICSLGALLHTTLDKSGHAEVRLTEEIEMARHYLRIQQVRFGEALRVELRVDPAAALAAIPTLSIQPLLENAVIHGLNGRAGVIRLQAWRSGERLVVEVTDEAADPNAPGGAPKPSSGVGLANIRARLATLHGARASLDLIRNPGGATARLEVPFRELGE